MINDILNRIASDTSRNFKLDVLLENKTNYILQQVVFLALDPLTQFHIRKIPEYTSNTSHNLQLGEELFAELDKLATRQVTGNAAIEFLRHLLARLHPSDAKVLERIIQKDLRCGISASTVNKVWPNLVHEYPCMLASAFDQKLVDKIKFPAYVQLKLDGMRFNAIVRNNTVEFRSRNGKEIQIADPTFAEPFIQMANGGDYVFDGELLVRDQSGVLCDRKTGNGILNKAVKGTQSVAEGRMVSATLWDVIPFAEFSKGVYKTEYHTRLSDLSLWHAEFFGGMPFVAAGGRIHIVPTTEVESLERAQDIFAQYLAEGQEGIILKSKKMIWEDKRSKHQIKFKQELEFEAEVIGWEEGHGKYAGMMGALLCRHGDIEFGLGSGFTEEDRKMFTRSYSIGKIITVKYNAVIDDKRTGKKSLFLPIYIEERLDKTSI